MAWNAVLATAPADAPITGYGRSYMEHLVALAEGAELDGDEIPADVRSAARVLRDTPAAAPELITIGKPDASALTAARLVLDHARMRVGVS